jgi:mannosyltransferase
MLMVVVLSYFFFMPQSLRLDEAQTLWQSSHSAADIITLVAQDVHVPLYFELLHFWRYITDSVQFGRVFSMLFYLASIPALYFLGKLAYDRSVGLFAATLLAASPFMNWYGNEIRMYTLFIFLTIVNQYCFIKIWKTDSEHAWAFYVITTLLGAFTHYFFFIVLFAQAVFFFLNKKLFAPHALRRFVMTMLLLAVCFAPWIYNVIHQGELGNSSPMLPIPTTVDLFNTFAQFLFGFQSDNVNTVLLSLWPATLILAFFALRKSEKLSPESLYFLLTFVLGIGLAFGVSFILPLFVSRYLIFTVPSMFLLITSFISLYPPRAARIARWATVCLMFAMLAVEIVSPTTPVKEDYRDASNYLTANASAEDVVIISAPFTIYPVEYYYRGEAPLTTLPIWDHYAYGPIPAFNEADLPAQVASSTVDAQDVWVLLSYNQGYQPQIQNYFQDNYQQLEHITFSPGLDLYEYKLRYDTPAAEYGTTTAMAQ